MTHTTRAPRHRWRRGNAALAAFAAVLVAAAGLATGAGAHPHHAGDRNDYPDYQPSGGHVSTPNDYPVAGIDYATAPEDLAPTPISVLKTSPHLASGLVFVAPKI